MQLLHHLIGLENIDTSNDVKRQNKDFFDIRWNLKTIGPESNNQIRVNAKCLLERVLNLLKFLYLYDIHNNYLNN